MKPAGAPTRFGPAAALILAAPLLALSAAAFCILKANALDATVAEREPAIAALERRVESLKRPGAPERDISAIYLPGGTLALAKANLQRLLVDAVDRSSGRLIEVDGGDVATDAPDDVARLRLTFDVKNAALLDILYDLETGLPLLSVERIEVRRQDDAAGDRDDPTLRTVLVVAGHVGETRN